MGEREGEGPPEAGDNDRSDAEPAASSTPYSNRPPWLPPAPVVEALKRIAAERRQLAEKVWRELASKQRVLGTQVPEMARLMLERHRNTEQLFARFAEQIKLPDFRQWAEWARQAQRQLAESLPPNWATVDDWLAIVELMEETKWSLVWVPGPEVLAQMLEASDAGQAGLVLVEQRAAVVADVQQVLDAVTEPSLATHRQGLEKALPVAVDGHYEAAQSLSATVFKGMIETALGGTLNRAGRQWRALSLMEQPVRDMRRTGVLVAAGAALAQYHPLKGDPVPTSFNRHAVAHGYSSAQFTPVNAMTGLLLAASFLRELQEWGVEADMAEAG